MTLARTLALLVCLAPVAAHANGSGLRFTNQGRHIAAALAKQGISVSSGEVRGRGLTLTVSPDKMRSELTGTWTVSGKKSGVARFGRFTFTNENGINRLTHVDAQEGKAPQTEAMRAARVQGGLARGKQLSADRTARLAEAARVAAAAEAAKVAAAKPQIATGSGGASLTRGANGFTYGAGPQGHANMLAADPGGRRTGYVNPQAPVARDHNMWAGHYR